jgi:alkanesulfonate monooxygenase SsuD/methylene tetrahydromethanopterin reductase-like flavin-dependent oxidoreductase (luciferase family)
MTDPTALSFGIKTSQIGQSYAEILRTWKEADEIALFQHAWLWDHMIPLRGDVRTGALEAWTLLAALAAQTSRLKLGVMVTSNRLRLPTLLAKMAATLDNISAGRLIFGIGAGGSINRSYDTATVDIVRREFDAYGVEVVPTAEAVAGLAEALSIIRRMWTDPNPFDVDGLHYRLRGAICEPKPVQKPGPPILIGGGGERLTLRVVAEHADIWNCPVPTAAEFHRKSAVLDEHCRAIGRDPADIVRSIQVIISQDKAAKAREDLLAFVEAGATHLVLAGTNTTATWLAEEIAVPVLSQAQ